MFRLIFICGLATLASAVLAQPASQAQPNILLLVAEDLSPRVRAFGDPVAVTPNIDQLAAEGTRYTRVFTTAGVCAPSRAALITGSHAISIGAQHMRTSTYPEGAYVAVPPPEVKAFPELLRASGYYTYTDSKLDYQFSGTVAGSGPFTVWSDEGRNTHWRNRPEGKPFFGMINFMVTHESGTFAPFGHWPRSLMHLGMQLYRRVTLGSIEHPVVSPDEVLLPPYYPDIPEVRTELARHYNNIHAMDQQVGELLAQLKADGLLENTIVIWTTDHGDGLPRAKRELYDSGINVPMIIRWPDHLRPADAAPGTLDARMISFVDLAPTILSLAGVEPPSFMQGRNFLASDERQYIYAARDRIDEIEDRQRAVRDGRYKYIRSWHPEVAGGHVLDFRDHQAMTRAMRELYQQGELNAAQAKWFEPVGEEQLYDLETDPHELNNLAADPEHQETLMRMRRALDDWLSGVEDTANQPETEMIEAMRCDGEQCSTAPPIVRVEKGLVVIEPVTPGSSLAYQINEGPWQIYHEPLDTKQNVTLKAKAVRYGWHESVAVSAPQ